MNSNSCVFYKASLLAILLCAGNASAVDDNCQKKLTQEEYRAFALKNSPLAAEIDSAYAADLSAAFETEVLANPELQIEQTFTTMHIGGANDPQTQASIGQPFRLSNLGSRQKVASLLRNAGDLKRKVQLLEFTQKLNLQFKTLSAYQETEKLLKDAESRASKKVLLIKEGVKKGLLTEGDEKLFEGEKYRLQAQVKSVSATIAVLQGELSQLIGIACGVRVSDERKVDAIPSEESLIQKARTSGLSESSRSELISNLSKEQVRLAELDSFPQITPKLIYQHTNDGGDFFGAGLSVQLPFWNRNQGGKIKAEAERNTAELRTTFIANGGLEKQISNLRQAAVSLQEQAELYSLKVIPSFEGALQSQEKLYSEGKGNVLQVWQTLRAFNEVQSQGLQLLTEAQAARVKLSIAVGEEV